MSNLILIRKSLYFWSYFYVCFSIVSPLGSMKPEQHSDWDIPFPLIQNTGKNNRFPFLDILGYLKNTHKNPKFGRVRQVPIRELGWEFPGWDLSHFAKFGIFMGIL